MLGYNSTCCISPQFILIRDTGNFRLFDLLNRQLFVIGRDIVKAEAIGGQKLGLSAVHFLPSSFNLFKMHAISLDGNCTNVIVSIDLRNFLSNMPLPMLVHDHNLLCQSTLTGLNNSLETDLTIVTKDGESLECHHLIVNLRCPALIQLEKQNVIVLDNYSVDTVRGLLVFLYTSRVPPVSDLPTKQGMYQLALELKLTFLAQLLGKLLRHAGVHEMLPYFRDLLFGDAEKSLQEEADSTILDAFMNGISAHSSGSYEFAVRKYGTAILLSEKKNYQEVLPILFYFRAKSYLKMNSTVSCSKDLEKAITNQPNNCKFLLLKAKLLQAEMKYSEAFSIAVKAFQMEPENWTILSVLYSLYDSLAQRLEHRNLQHIRLLQQSHLSTQMESLITDNPQTKSCLNIQLSDEQQSFLTPVHRLFLRMSSRFFCDLLSELECQDHFNMENILPTIKNKDEWLSIFKWFYSKSLDIKLLNNTSSVVKMLQIVEFLNVDTALRDQIELWLIMKIDEKNVVEMIDLAERFQCTELYNRCIQLLNFKKLPGKCNPTIQKKLASLTCVGNEEFICFGSAVLMETNKAHLVSKFVPYSWGSVWPTVAWVNKNGGFETSFTIHFTDHKSMEAVNLLHTMYHVNSNAKAPLMRLEIMGLPGNCCVYRTQFQGIDNQSAMEQRFFVKGTWLKFAVKVDELRIIVTEEHTGFTVNHKWQSFMNGAIITGRIVAKQFRYAANVSVSDWVTYQK